MSDTLLVYVTFPSQAEAERVAETLLAERLVACANILGACTSIYRWEGRIERAEEVPVLFKSRPMLATRLRERLEQLHSYDLQVIEQWSVTTSIAAADWIQSQTA